MSLAAIACAFSLAQAAHAECHRPTDKGGFNGYSYGVDTASHFDGKSVRVWYAMAGLHAVDTTTTRVDKVPDNVVTAATIADAALASYAQMGFLPPVGDGVCGGDARLDIYLMHFNAADGDVATEDCGGTGNSTQCAVFAQVEARLEDIYGSFALGGHVVIAHELFHAVQNAYDSGLDRFWAEGTAQWAAKTLYAGEMDLEQQLPAFFAGARRSIDSPPGGAAAGYDYGAAIWPVFLSQRLGPDVVRKALEQEATLGPPSMDAIAAAINADGSSIAAEYSTFAAWNAATGKRAGSGGYLEAKSFPEVSALTPLDATGAADIVSGYSVFYYAFDFGAAQRQLVITGDPTRLVGKTFPLVAGNAQLGSLAPLPAMVTGAGVLVVAGVSGKKSDAPFTVQVAASAMPDSSTTVDGGTGDNSGGGGCAIGARTHSRLSLMLVALALLMLRCRGRSRSRA